MVHAGSEPPPPQLRNEWGPGALSPGRKLLGRGAHPYLQLVPRSLYLSYMHIS
jgi:hypothetical protein